MLNIRAACLWLLLLTLPAFAQAPPPIPPLPDTNRTVAYSISVSTAQVAVPFNVYGDCSDIQVQINGVVVLLSNGLWNCASSSGFALNTLPLPITDMVVNLTPALTSGTLAITGAWHARNPTIPTAPGISRREYQQAINTITAGQREVSDLVSSVGYGQSPVFTNATVGNNLTVGGTIIGGVGAASVLNVGGTTQSTSTLTGAILDAGGLGVVKNAWFGGTLNVAGASTLGSVSSAGTVANAPTINSIDTNKITAAATPSFNFNSTEGITSFASGSTHFGMVVQATKNAPGSNTTGSRQAFIAQQLGAGGTSADYFTAGQELASPTAGTFGNSGNWSGNNPGCIIPAGMTPTSCVGEEVDVETGSNVTNIREGVRIADLGSTGLNGAGIDAAIGVISAGIGFQGGLVFGDAGGLYFPITAGGNFIITIPSAVVLNSFIDFSAMTAAPVKGGILLPPNLAGVCWGTTSACPGGQILSSTTTGGGYVQFGNATTTIAAGTSAFVLSSGSLAVNAPVNLMTYTIAQLLAITCNAASESDVAWVKDTVGSATPTFHLAVALGGATAVHSMASCNGTAWVYN
jgi:hypothetical protein